MQNNSKFNKSISIILSSVVLLGGSYKIANAIPEKNNLGNSVVLMNKFIAGENSLKGVKSGLYEVNVNSLKEKEEEPSMAGAYLEKINYEVKEGKHSLILFIDSIDWMKNIAVTVDGKEINVEPMDVVNKKESDGKGEKTGKIRFDIKDLYSKILLTMNVVPMGNARVSFRVIPVKDSLKLIKEYKEKTEIKEDTKDDIIDSKKDGVLVTKKNETENKVENTTKKQDEKSTEKDNIKVTIGENSKDDVRIKENNKVVTKKGTNKEKELPKTGMPVNTRNLTILGTIITALGVVLKKKRN